MSGAAHLNHCSTKQLARFSGAASTHIKATKVAFICSELAKQMKRVYKILIIKQLA
jgi:hypothetical protein